MDKIAILIPCYNESLTIKKVVSDWERELPEATVYVYDNNSNDGTDEIAKNASVGRTVIRYCHQQGKGNVVRKMFREIEAECYIMVDGDDTYPASAGPAMAAAVLEQGADMVVGDRLSSTYYEENKRPFHNFGNALVKWFINHIFHCDITDIMTGYRAFSYEFVKSFPVLSKGFEIETEMTIFAVDKNMYITNQVIEYRDRPNGSVSKLNTYFDGLRVLRTIIRLFRDYRPLQFFGMISLFLTIISALFFAPVFRDYLIYGTVERFPTLIVCGFTIIAALISMFAGLILHSLKQQELREFEFKLQMIEKIKKDSDSNFTNPKM